MLSATVKQEIPLWKRPPPPGANIPELPEATGGRNMDVKQYLKKFRKVKQAKIDQYAFQDEELGYVVLQEIEKVPEIWQTEKISRRIDPWAKVGAATFNRTGSLVNIATMTKIFNRGRCHLRDRIRTKIASVKKFKEVFLDEDLENYLWTFPDYFALRFYREMLEKHVGYCRTRDCFDANGEPICFTIEDSEDEEETQEVEEENDDEQYVIEGGEYDDMVIEERLVYEEDLVVGVEEVLEEVQEEMQDIYAEQSIERQKNVPRFQRGAEDGQAEQLPRRRTVDNGPGTSASSRGPQQNAATPRKPGVLINQNQIQLMQQQIKQRHQNPPEERHEPEDHHLSQQQERIPEPQQPIPASQVQQAPPPENVQLQNPPQQPYRHYDPNTDIGFMAYNMQRIGMEHPERQQLILNTMNCYLQIFSSNLPPNTTPEDIYEFLAREYPNEAGERL
ncbi:hypothetical protein L5515_015755 [Caenorhabditis briggsae]|uniref:Uncharacterized protein n=1 Tax=Caenorhabditis briggsae TaxID=6238 RepID=A0AAE9J8I7_CAEBR|nr:hypothetical protein L5515_015755 [Caenorhabditis briggsae]